MKKEEAEQFLNHMKNYEKLLKDNIESIKEEVESLEEKRCDVNNEKRFKRKLLKEVEENVLSLEK